MKMLDWKLQRWAGERPVSPEVRAEAHRIAQEIRRQIAAVADKSNPAQPLQPKESVMPDEEE